MRRTLTLGGGTNATTSSGCAASIAASHTGIAERPPVSPLPSGRGLSNPTHATATRCGVNPANHASWALADVPVLPATGRPSALALVPVPDCTTLCIMLVRMNATSSPIATCGSVVGAHTVCPRTCTSSTMRGSIREPPRASVM